MVHAALSFSGSQFRLPARCLPLECLRSASQVDTRANRILKNITRALFLLSLCAGSVAAQRSPATGPAQIILIRHGEEPKDNKNPHLSAAGRKRAQDLVSFITTDPEMTKLGTPVALYATRTTKHDTGVRTQETLVPLAQSLKLRVQTPFLGSHYAELAKAVLSNPRYAGKTVLICWNHETIPQLVSALGVTPEPAKWKGKVFDQVYVISYRKKNPTLQVSRYGAN